MNLIEVNNLSKKYVLHSTKSERLKYALGLKKGPLKVHNALQSINFTVASGDTIGIIGRNGSGKSSLLKIIAGIVPPTSGSLKTTGKIQALIELGAGFNMELTGAQNIKFYGALMGMSMDAIQARYDDIVSFSELGKFIDEPVKFYSSGMKSRLAFSVAIHTDPDVLIVDEVLSVGDYYFRQKCIDRLTLMLAKGLTLLYVSHNIGEVKALCRKALYLKDGVQVAFGASEDVCNLYQVGSESYTIKKDILHEDWQSMPLQEKYYLQADKSNTGLRDFGRENLIADAQRSGGKEIIIAGAFIANERGERLDSALSGSTVKILIDIESKKNVDKGACFGILIRDNRGIDVFAINSDHVGCFLPAMGAGEQSRIEIELYLPLVAGVYSLSLGLKPDPLQNFFYDRCFNAVVFEVERPAYQTVTGGLIYHRAKSITLKQ